MKTLLVSLALLATLAALFLYLRKRFINALIATSRRIGRHYASIEDEFNNIMLRECSDDEQRIHKYLDLHAAATKACIFLREAVISKIDQKQKHILEVRLLNFDQLAVNLGEIAKQQRGLLEFEGQQSTLPQRYLTGLRVLSFDLTGTQAKIDERFRSMNQRISELGDELEQLLDAREKELGKYADWRDDYIRRHKIIPLDAKTA